MRHPVTITLGALLFMTACTPEAPPVSATAPTPAEDACGAADLQGLLGQPVTGQDFTGSAGAQRIMAEGSPMTMDYRHDRLNVTYDDADRITRIWCG